MVQKKTLEKTAVILVSLYFFVDAVQKILDNS